MTDKEWTRLRRKRSKLAVIGTLNPFCRNCGEHGWCSRYDMHHFARRKYDDRVIRLCIICHNKVSEMEKDFPPIPANTDPRLARAIATTRGRICIFKLALETDEEMEQWLSGSPFLPPLPDETGGNGNA